MKKKFAAYLAAMMIVFAWVPATARAQSGAPVYTTAETTVVPEPVYAVDEQGNLAEGAVNATAAIAVDADTGQTLYERLADQQLYPASITKVMTCLLTLEYAEKSGKGLSEQITVEHTYTMEKGAVGINLKVGESFTIEQLLYALMLKSANDTALLLAEHIGGSVEGFAQMMNEKAQTLGMTHTHYVNPNGLHDDDHYTTARDMATLMTEAIKNETFRTIIMTLQYSIPATSQTAQARGLTNSNCLIKSGDTNYYELCKGGKTGYTSKARNTMVSYGEKDGRTVVVVVLQSPVSTTRFASARNLLRYGLENFTTVDLAAAAEKNPISATVTGAGAVKDGALSVPTQQVPQGTAKRLVRNQMVGEYNALEGVQTQIQWEDNLVAPIAKGQKLGTVTYLENGEAVLVCDIVAAQDVAAAAEGSTAAGDTQPGGEAQTLPARSGGEENVVSWMTIALIVLIALIVIVALMLLHASRSQSGNRRGSHQRRTAPYGRAGSTRRPPARGRDRDMRGRR